MNMDHLRSFYTAAKEGNISKAVELLMMSQPLFTGQVKRMEETLGVTLMIHEGDSIHLTRAGQTVFRMASRIFHEIQESQSLLEPIFSRRAAQLRIGCPEAPGNRLMPKLVAELEKLYPGIRIIVNHGKDTTMAKSVEDGRNELAVIRFRPKNCRLKLKMVGKEELVLIASAFSVHVPGNEIRVRDLAQVPFILPKEGSAVREVVLEYLRKLEISPKVILGCSSVALTKELVMRDNAVAFIERSAVDEELDQCFLKEVRITEGSPAIAIAIGYLSGKELSPPARSFLRLLAQTEKTVGLSTNGISDAYGTSLSPAAHPPLYEKSIHWV